MNKRKVIIDTDCGSDDAMAIAMALNDPRYEITMFSTVSGNVHIDQATLNTLSTIEYCGTYEPPVYLGCAEMLNRKLVYAYETHGNDGMGDLGIRPKRLRAEEDNGVLKMLQLLRDGKNGEYDVIALGPLTNIAVALRLAPDVMGKIGKLVVMGSAGLGSGNVSPTAEFNIWQDPEAAQIVVTSGLKNIVFVGWDACLGDSMLNPEDIRLIRNSGPLGKFVIEINGQLMHLNQERFHGDYLDMADPAAVAAALEPDCIAECVKYYCEVDTTNGPSQGTVLVDVNYFSGKEPNVWICSKLDSKKYKAYIYRTLHVNAKGDRKC